MRILLRLTYEVRSNLIWSFMITIISFLTNWCRNHWKWFLWWTTFQFGRRYNYLIKFYFPPTHFFQEKLLLYKGSILGNECFAFGFVIEGVPNSFLWVFYEDALLRFRFKLIRLKPFHISIATPNFKKWQLWFLAKPQFIRRRLNGFWWCPI